MSFLTCRRETVVRNAWRDEVRVYGKLNKDDNACEGVPQAGMTDLGDALIFR